MNHEIESFSDFILHGAEIHYYGSEDSILSFRDMLSHGTLYTGDAPDFYIVDGDTILIIEHFEFDCFAVNRKGSVHRQEMAKINRIEKDIPYTEDGTLRHVEIKGHTSYQDYISNASRSFEEHYSHIDLYIENLKKSGRITDTSKVKVMFFIEDVSPLGSMAVQYNEDDPPFIPINLAYCKDFIRLLENHKRVDYVLSCSSYGNVKEVWFVDNRELDEYHKHEFDFASMEFADFSTNVLTYKRLIPIEEQ